MSKKASCSRWGFSWECFCSMCEKYSPKVWVKDPGRWFGPTCRSRSDRVPTEATGMMSGLCDGCRQIGKCRLSDSWFAASDWRLYEPSEAQRAAAVSWRANRQMLGLKRAEGACTWQAAATLPHSVLFVSPIVWFCVLQFADVCWMCFQIVLIAYTAAKRPILKVLRALKVKCTSFLE